MPRDTYHEDGARIGPNAILQLINVLDDEIGPDARDALLQEIDVQTPAADGGMIPEGPAALLHQAARVRLGSRAPAVLSRAGRQTGDYILARRIPTVAQSVLRNLPTGIAAKTLADVIKMHAWTFAGSGRFRVVTPWTFEIIDNPVVRGEHSAGCLCHWHAAVFETLYRRLVTPSARCREIRCVGQGDASCRFKVRRG